MCGELINHSIGELKAYPFIKKHIFKWLGRLSEDEVRARQSDINVCQGLLIRAAREWRTVGLDSIHKATGISPEQMMQIESGSCSIRASDWACITNTLNIQDDAETFQLLLESAYDSRKKKARLEMSNALMAMGLRQIKNIEQFYPAPRLSTDGKILFMPNNNIYK